MQALSEQGSVPVPRVVGYEPASEVLGRPFFVMERVEGRVPQDDPPFTVDGWVLADLDDAQRARLYDNGLRALGAVHSVDPVAAGLGFLARDELGAGEPLAQQLTYYESFYEWASEGESLVTIEAAFAWLHANRPTTPEPTCLSWGDSRVGNMIFGPDMSVRAVLDWEMAWLASPSLDLGWWLFFDRYYTDGLGVPRPGGFPRRREETLERYEQLTGVAPQHVDYYEAFAALRGSVIAVRLARLLKDAGALPHDSDMARSNPAITTMAQLMELPPPSERASSFISKQSRA
jgi:aminoglycoside phosphotransferase (APT) family kinase protein